MDRARTLRPVDVGRGRFDQLIVGESHHQDSLRRLKESAAVLVGDVPIVPFLLVREQK
jgi:hypothetical protein